MAKIQEEIIVVKLSKLVKDADEDLAQLGNNVLRSALEDAAQQLVGETVVVEIERK
jgi:hypothetical protein